MSSWYLYYDGSVKGPFGAEMVLKKLFDAEVPESTLTRSELMLDWQPLSTLRAQIEREVNGEADAHTPATAAEGTVFALAEEEEPGELETAIAGFGIHAALAVQLLLGGFTVGGLFAVVNAYIFNGLAFIDWTVAGLIGITVGIIGRCRGMMDLTHGLMSAICGLVSVSFSALLSQYLVTLKRNEKLASMSDEQRAYLEDIGASTDPMGFWGMLQDASGQMMPDSAFGGMMQLAILPGLVAALFAYKFATHRAE